MVCEVVVHRHASRYPHHFEPPLDTRERLQGLADPIRSDPDVRGHRDGRKRITNVVDADERHLELSERRTLISNLETGARSARDDIVGLPVGVLSKPERLLS
jgi:hypothetical protein